MWCGRENNGPDKCPHPHPQILDSMLHAKRDFANVIGLRNLRTGDCPGFYGGAQCNQYPNKREARGSKLKIGDVKMEQRSE